jgi:hypothetical protein
MFSQRDEDFDGSYENLLSLSGLIGDAKPKATPDHIVSELESASYKDWATPESDHRCPICLDDVSICFPAKSFLKNSSSAVPAVRSRDETRRLQPLAAQGMFGAMAQRGKHLSCLSERRQR